MQIPEGINDTSIKSRDSNDSLSIILKDAEEMNGCEPTSEKIEVSYDYDNIFFSIWNNNLRDEILHAKILYSLLNSVFQDSILEKLFKIENLKDVDGKEISLDIRALKNPCIKREYCNQFLDGRIDLFISACVGYDRRVDIVIELKMNADDSRNQLESYKRFLKELSADYQLLYYISLDGKKSKETSNGYNRCRISDIIPSVDSCKDECMFRQESSSSFLARQYFNLIKMLEGC